MSLFRTSSLRRTDAPLAAPIARRATMMLCACMVLAAMLFPMEALAKKKQAAPANPYSSANKKYASLVMDAKTGQIISESGPDKIVHPASLTKIMTLMMVFDAIKSGKTSLNDQVRISAHAAAMAPSKLGLKPGSSIRLEDAVLAVVTKSANDMAAALAEHVGGSESNFAAMMTRKARQIGMSRSTFMNASGLHNAKQVTTARDMAQLARVLIYSYPEYYHYFSRESFTYRGNRFANHNHLMERYQGMDGIKTGYTNPSGFNLVSSVKRGDRRLIGVVFGGVSARSRDQHMAKLLDAAFKKNEDMRIARADIPGKDKANDPTEAARWNALAPMLQNKAVTRIVGDGSQPVHKQETPRPLAKVERLSVAGISPASGTPTGPAPPQARNGQQVAYTARGARDWAVQIGAYSSRVKTDQSLQSAQARLPATLNHGTAVIAPLKTPNGWLFRGRINGFTMAEANQACAVLTECLTISPGTN